MHDSNPTQLPGHPPGEPSHRRPHPPFADRGTLDWRTRWADALARARAESRIVLVEFGREL